MKNLDEMREELEKQLKRITEVEEIKKDLEANSMKKWKCIGIEKIHHNQWKLTYEHIYELCGRKITEKEVFPISFV